MKKTLRISIGSLLLIIAVLSFVNTISVTLGSISMLKTFGIEHTIGITIMFKYISLTYYQYVWYIIISLCISFIRSLLFVIVVIYIFFPNRFLFLLLRKMTEAKKKFDSKYDSIVATKKQREKEKTEEKIQKLEEKLNNMKSDE